MRMEKKNTQAQYQTWDYCRICYNVMNIQTDESNKTEKNCMQRWSPKKIDNNEAKKRKRLVLLILFPVMLVSLNVMFRVFKSSLFVFFFWNTNWRRKNAQKSNYNHVRMQSDETWNAIKTFKKISLICSMWVNKYAKPFNK